MKKRIASSSRMNSATHGNDGDVLDLGQDGLVVAGGEVGPGPVEFRVVVPAAVFRTHLGGIFCTPQQR